MLRLVALSIILASAAASTAVGAPGDVRWIFDLDTPFAGRIISIGPDGTVYALNNTTLFALNPDGSVKWTRNDISGGTPVDFLPDGGLVTHRGDVLFCLNTVGTTRWTFTYDSNNLEEQIELGPNVGPDGNIYAVTSVQDGFGLGVFSLTPEGDLRWTGEGSPPVDNISVSTSDLVYFSEDRLYFPFDFTAAGAPLVYGYDFDGDQTFLRDTAPTSIPRVDPQGRVIITGSSSGIHAVDPDSGSDDWNVDIGNSHLIPELDDAGNVYTGTFFNRVASIDPDGNIRWQSGDDANPNNILGVSNPTRTLVYAGAPTFGFPDFIAGRDADTGTEIFSTTLRTIGGLNEFVGSNTAAISPDGSTAYVVTVFASLGANGAVWAIELGDDTVPCPADVTGDGQIDLADLNLVLANFGQTSENGDTNDDNQVDLADLNAVLAAFGQACP